MAEANISVDQEQFSCPLCLDLLKDPVTTPCGHSFCMECINDYWDRQDPGGVYSCPQCRETFTPRTFLRRNNMLNEVVEKLKKNALQSASTEHSYTGPGDVECDFCNGTKCRAVKSCLICLASFCETHLKTHYDVPSWKKHKLIEVSTKLQEKVCSHHDEVLKIYCRTDQTCICSMCMLDKHRGHDFVSVAAERSEKECVLKEEKRKFQQRIHEKQKKVQELKQAVINIKHSAQAAVDDSEKIFTEMIRSLEKKRSEVTKLIRDQEKAELSRAEEFLQELEKEIADLKRRTTELGKFPHTHDDVHFLQSFQSLCVSSGCEDSTSIIHNQHFSFNRVRKSLSDMKERLEELCKEDFNKISECAVQVILPPEPKSREDFLKYFCYLTLDPNTANPNLILSEKNRVVTRSYTLQPYFDHPERFDFWKQVLCKESMCGRCYWEVKRSGVSAVGIAVSHKGIRRKGQRNAFLFGYNSLSWCLYFSPSSFSFWHNNIRTELKVPPSSRIGVYVDHSAGTLSFYSISDTMRLLHRVQTKFTDLLYTGFFVGDGSTMKLCDPV